MIKMCNVCHIDNITPVSLDKTIHGESLDPILNRVNRKKMIRGSMYDYFSLIGFHTDNIGCWNGINSLSGFDRDSYM